MASPSVEPGRYDLVIDPTNLWLTIHESIGHSTELDRVLGYEANYAGTSFATLDKLNTLQFGSPIMHVTGDREVNMGLSTVGYDDEGVAAQTWDIVRDGVLVGYQLDRQMAHKQGFGRSNGCAFADAAGSRAASADAQRLACSASPKTITLDDLIGAVDDGIYIVGDKSWSIDMQRYNFQFTGQKFFRIRGGKIVGQVKDVAYQAQNHRLLECDGGRRRPLDVRPRRRVQLRQGTAEPDCAGHATDARRRSSGRSTSSTRRRRDTDRHPGYHRARPARCRRPTPVSSSASSEAVANVRWANNTVTTNGAVDKASLTIVSIIGTARRIA